MLSKTEIIEFLKSHKKYFYEKFGVKRIGLFGSYVRNEQTDQSDIDIVVSFVEGKKNFDNYMDLKFFLQDHLKKEIDVIIESTIKLALRPYIYKEIHYV